MNITVYINDIFGTVTIYRLVTVYKLET